MPPYLILIEVLAFKWKWSVQRGLAFLKEERLPLVTMQVAS